MAPRRGIRPPTTSTTAATATTEGPTVRSDDRIRLERHRGDGATRGCPLGRGDHGGYLAHGSLAEAARDRPDRLAQMVRSPGFRAGEEAETPWRLLVLSFWRSTCSWEMDSADGLGPQLPTPRFRSGSRSRASAPASGAGRCAAYLWRTTDTGHRFPGRRGRDVPLFPRRLSGDPARSGPSHGTGAAR